MRLQVTDTFSTFWGTAVLICWLGIPFLEHILYYGLQEPQRGFHDRWLHWGCTLGRSYQQPQRRVATKNKKQVTNEAHIVSSPSQLWGEQGLNLVVRNWCKALFCRIADCNKNLAVTNKSRVSCLKSKSRVTRGHWKQNHWTDHTRLTISRLWPWNVG